MTITGMTATGMKTTMAAATMLGTQAAMTSTTARAISKRDIMMTIIAVGAVIGHVSPANGQMASGHTETMSTAGHEMAEAAVLTARPTHIMVRTTEGPVVDLTTMDLTTMDLTTMDHTMDHTTMDHIKVQVGPIKHRARRTLAPVGRRASVSIMAQS